MEDVIVNVGTVLVAKNDAFMDISKVRFLTKGKTYKVNRVFGSDNRFFSIESDIDKDHSFGNFMFSEFFEILEP